MAAGPGRLSKAALGFGLAALASAWNPVSAPLGLAVGLAAAFLAVRALARGGRWLARLGLGASLAAIFWSGAVLALTAGIGRGPGGEAIAPKPAESEVGARLDAAAKESREARERARRELESLDGARR